VSGFSKQLSWRRKRCYTGNSKGWMIPLEPRLEVRVYEGHRSLDKYVNVYPSLGKDVEPPTNEKTTLKE
jgi:hypothetical protein